MFESTHWNWVKNRALNSFELITSTRPYGEDDKMEKINPKNEIAIKNPLIFFPLLKERTFAKCIQDLVANWHEIYVNFFRPTTIVLPVLIPCAFNFFDHVKITVKISWVDLQPKITAHKIFIIRCMVGS